MTTATIHASPSMRQAVGQFVRLLRLIRPYWRRLMHGLAIGAVVSVLGMVTPYLTKLLIDEVYPSHDVTLMHVLVGGILGVGTAAVVLGALRSYYNLFVNTRLSSATSLLFFNHLQHLPVGFFDQHRVGEVTSRFSDVGRALQSVFRVFQTVMVQGAYLVVVPPFLLLLHWKLALVALVCVPFTVLFTTLAGRLMRRYWQQSAEAHADLSALQVETLSHIRTLKTMAVEHHVYRQARGQVGHALRMQVRAGGVSELVGAGNGLLYALNTALFTWLGWVFILSGQMTLGSYIAFSTYVGYLYVPIREMVNLYSDFQQSAVSIGRMFEYLDCPAEQDPTSAYVPPMPIRRHLRGEITLRNISYRYSPGRRVLENVDLQADPGTYTAIVGPSGSGKTSLLRLLVGMGQPDAGQILFDGIDHRQIGLSDLRRQIAVVWQEFSLLKGTIWDNLTVGLDHVRRDAVERAVEICRLEALIGSLPDGYGTNVSEWGASLSGGQRQRLALARALIRNSPILLLDEVTSNVDVQTETSILRDLVNAFENRTILFVTHRLKTAALAHQICVLDDGCVAGVGTHDELLDSCRRYRDMQQPAHDECDAMTVDENDEMPSLKVLRGG